MATPVAYKRLRAKQNQQRVESSKQYKLVSRVRSKEEKDLYNKVLKALRPYHETRLDNHEVWIRPDPEERSVDFYVDDYLYLTFSPERRYLRCHCDNVCEHKTNTSVTLTCRRHRKEDGDIDDYFSCRQEDLGKPDIFAEALADMMDKFDE